MQTLNLKLKGLYTHANPLSEVPEGALVRAKNCVMDKEGIIETRRGLAKYGAAFSVGVGEKINTIFTYQDKILVHYGSKLAYDSDDAGTFIDYSGTFAPPSGAFNIRALESNKNFYFTTNAGVKKLDSVTGTPTAAGGIKALDGTATVLATGTGFLTNNNQVAYRIVWGITDANDNLILGSPSQRIIAINSSGAAQDVSVAFTIPAGITTSHFYQIYRSKMSGGVAVVPNDELGLVYENNPTAGQITAKSVTVTDIVPENLRDTLLYTSPSQQGIGQANEAPPLCKDMAFYKNTVLYANTTGKQRIIVTLIAVGGTYGVAANDTITIGGVVYTGKATENASAGEFDVVTGGTAAENIDATAQSLVRVINTYASNTSHYAYYLSGYNDLPGKILIEERSIGGSSLPVISSRGSAYNPTLPSSGTTVSTSNDRAKNRLCIAKYQQPEAVPILNVLDIGSASQEILRVIALRDSVFIFKEDGLFRLTGEDISSFRVSLFDVTVILTAPETAAPFNNQIFAYTSQGVVAISDTGSAIISRPIEVDLLQIATFGTFASVSFGVAYNSDRKYILFIPSEAGDEYATQAYVYNSISNAWTRWVMSRSCGIVNANDDKLYFGSANNGYVYKERKTFTKTDYADDEVALTIVSSSGTSVEVTSNTGVEVGWSLAQGSRISTITEVSGATTLVVEDVKTWTSGDATAYVPISVEVETVPQTAGNPGILKQYSEFAVFFRRANFRTITLGVRSDVSAYLENTEITRTSEIGWGRGGWGRFAWGGTSPDLQYVRTFVPRNKQRCHWLSINITHSTAKDNFAIAGFSVNFKNMSSRFK